MTQHPFRDGPAVIRTAQLFNERGRRGVFNVGRSAFYAGVKKGIYPRPRPISVGLSGVPLAEVEAALERIAMGDLPVPMASRQNLKHAGAPAEVPVPVPMAAKARE